MRLSAYLSVNRVALPRMLSWAFKAYYVLLGVVALAFAPASDLAAGLLGLASVVGIGSLVVSFVLSLIDSFSRGEVEIAPDRVVLQRGSRRRRVVLRRDIAGALLVRRALPGLLVSVVELTLKNGDRLHLRVDDVETAREVVRALGFGPDGARVRADLGLPSRRWLHLPLGFGVYFVVQFVTTMLIALDRSTVFAAAQVVGPLAQIALYLALAKALAAPRVVVGRDGVIVHRGLRTRRYRGDDPSLLGALRGIGVDGARAEAVAQAARERAAAGAGVIGSLFERGGLPLGEWRGRIAAALAGGYREAGNVTETAKGVLGSAHAAPDARVGAALALRVAGDVEAVRRAAEATADDRVRVVLDAVADAPDAVIEERLRRLA